MTLLELIDRCADARQEYCAAEPGSGEAYDYFKETTELRAEIARRLELINRYGGTEASHIKSILATGAPVDYETERAARRKLGDRAPQG